VGEGAQRLVPHQLASGLALIDDTYNANPASMSASVRAAAEMAGVLGRPLVLVLGEMRELGALASPGHAEVGRVAAESGARLVITVGGPDARRMADAAVEAAPERSPHREVTWLGAVDEGLATIARAVLPSDLVLVKGSRAVGADRIVAELLRAHAVDDGGSARQAGLRPQAPVDASGPTPRAPTDPSAGG
jgi:UDP-N-acetylmuramoyl-tripeptide--D-alanyl-D-alanine ligase